MMRVKRNKLIVVVIGFLVLLEVTSIFLMWKSSMNKPTILDNVKLQNIKNDGNLAIMIEQEDGSYKETSGNSWPEDMMFNEEKSGCVDNNGQIIENALVYEDGIATVETGVTSNCYLYFDLKKDDVTIAISTDGVSGTMPSSGKYTNSASCSSGNITWSDKYQRIEIDNLLETGNKCNLSFTKDTSSKTLLRNEVESKATTINAYGHRYSGTNPDNYIWFNNEMWRIIGSIPTCLSSGCTSQETLVKIIRNQSIGGIAYDLNGVGAWGRNTLYTLLNTYYYGAQDGTESDYCYTSTASKPSCDYSEIGIKATDYYGKMVKNIYWKTGFSGNAGVASAAYGKEIGDRTISGYVGLMNASDYGYAADSSYHSYALNKYNNSAITLSNWLYVQSLVWLGTPGNSSNAGFITDSGYIDFQNGAGYVVRPVVYLDSSVYIINGTGTESDPYIIGM